jgi:hypothetical protein
MSISIGKVPYLNASPEVLAERNRAALIVEGLPLGYRNEDEHEVLENFARRVAYLIRVGVTATESID